MRPDGGFRSRRRTDPQLSELLKETGLSEIEYEAEGARIRVARNLVSTAPALTAAAASAEPPRAAGAERGNGEAPSAEAIPHNAILAPMVGTAYLASEPGGPSFVTLGDTVKEGDSLLIIEAMKVMNQIPSPRSGRITRILVEDGQPVEYGEPLMVVE